MNIEKCRVFFENFREDTLLCGFSGGADSTAALLIARHFQKEFSYRLEAVHFHHHLRGSESDAEARDAECFAAQRNIPFRRIDLNIPSSGNLEEQARLARLAAWERLSLEFTSVAIVTGHHADDRVENLLLRLGRGGNVSSLSSLRPTVRLGRLRFLRPLLHFSRAEIEEFLRENGISDFARDSSNSDETIQRNFLRRRLLPEWEQAFPPVAAGLRRALSSLECDADFIERAAETAFSPLHGKCKVQRSFFQNLHPALRCRVLRKWLAEQTGNDSGIPHEFFDRFQEFLYSSGSELKRLPCPGNCFLFFSGSLIAFPAPPPSSPQKWDWENQPRLEWDGFHFSLRRDFPPATRICDTFSAFFDADQLPRMLELRPVRPGDRMIPFGRTGEESVKKLRTDRKISATIPLVALCDEADRILWIPGVRNSAHFPVTPETVHPLQFRCVGSTSPEHSTPSSSAESPSIAPEG